MTSSKLLSEPPEHLSTQPALEFDYGKLGSEIRMVVQQRTNEIKNLMRNTTKDIIEIGQKLTDVKAQLGHGNFRNWLKTEFDWSVKTASRFMQVTENFKCVNLTHLDIAASALYLLASPSTPEEARAEVLKYANLGENITYTKAKAIVAKYKKASKPKTKKFATFHLETVESDLTKSIEQEGNGTSSVPDVLFDLTGKEVKTETRLLSIQDLMPSSEFQDRHLVPTVERNREQLEDTTPTPASIVNQIAIAQKIPDTITTEIEVKIKQLTPEQLASVIINSANTGLSKFHLEAIITAAQQVLNQLN
ncbi:DUF3102 domain-containing protein [Scytonema sp. UIC 10036]|uniref:DUF3102 domain-containing protein n=1 Tax=Scytonema sp. UIC 10036 TaxID=2304196 RepID=UPI0012DA810C|nr:DUF3102 domain-containing protein [Scytonema sp. UIC 10036]MUH00592.1 DUF3102 domain-containing protein [Scytonema sp. UIC 10036]